ncbi:DUF4249 domain-containing protein [Spirosoma sp. BT702]|uniref:DUF4249 domain-containing protein n=1 Tax=Spirosoma profusum TaxID=2771354 RepID=A0A926XTZ7_9BACT|nr:DUF4249 domain-containing protein [Spirosoma profusum]MBD2699894.1 DUF4249 domain-containing protein [Spirosoma profusum]
MNKQKLIGWLCIALVGGCVDPYRPPEIASPASYLVVNGFFNSAPGTTTTIRLSRTQNLTDFKTPTAETKAIVTIEAQSKAVYTLNEGTPGSYTLAGVTPVSGDTYRLHIKTRGTDYYSDYVPVVKTPPIDSISWDVVDDGLQISANTHDPQNNTRYYRWEFDATWEYYSRFYSSLELKNNQIVGRQIPINRCWNSESSTNIITTSTVRLKQDIVSKYPLTFIPGTSLKLESRYSILVRQSSLTQSGFEYYDQLAKITQNIGSIFDPQPSQITGNIKSSASATDLVMGFFRVGNVETKRIFITKSQLPVWYTITGQEGCEIDTLGLGDILDSRPAIIEPYNKLYLTTPEYCADCRLRGGVLTKPDFW